MYVFNHQNPYLLTVTLLSPFPPKTLAQVGACLKQTLVAHPDWRFLLDANQVSVALASLLPGEVSRSDRWGR